MEFRKLIEFGKSSYVISVPRQWVRENGLKKGDIISLEETGGGLIILPKSKETPAEKKSIKISTEDMNLEEIDNQISNKKMIEIFTFKQENVHQ